MDSLSLAELKRTPVRTIRWSDTDVESSTLRYILLVMMPIWIAAGVADWYWHKDTDIEGTSGLQESFIHSLMMTEVGIPIVGGLLFEVNALVLVTMMSALGLHWATSFWDVTYAVHHREVKTREQHTHSFLELLPLMAVSFMLCLHAPVTHRLLAVRTRKEDWQLRWKKPRLPFGYLVGMGAAIAVGVALPYANELWRCWKALGMPKRNTGFYKDLPAGAPDQRNG